jgi:hypothetical protein
MGSNLQQFKDKIKISRREITDGNYADVMIATKCKTCSKCIKSVRVGVWCAVCARTVSS